MTTDLGLPPHAVEADRVLRSLETDRLRGLSGEEASKRFAEHGANELAEPPPTPLWRKLVKQFSELVIWILIVAAVLAGFLGEWPDTLAILSIVLINGTLGFFQEERAERAIASLKKLAVPQAKVFRDGALRTIAARELVPGDRIEIEAGDKVPADGRLIEAFGFRVQEAALTGESSPVEKDAHGVLSAEMPVADRRNMVYMGTVAAVGRASAVVVATGMRTELGGIAGLLQREIPEPTPLQRRLTELGKVLVVFCLAIVAAVFTLQILRGGKVLDVALISVSLAVAAVPEGLPAVVTTALALGLQRMVRRNALVRRLPSVETLGSVTVICSDKTGTLTRNEMTVRSLMAGGRWFQVSGAGYRPHGEFRRQTGPPVADGGQGEADGGAVDPKSDPDLTLALTIAARCNNARLRPRPEDEDAWDVIGDPTEGALLVAALKGGIAAADGAQEVLYEIPFDAQRKAMSVVVRSEAGGVVMYTKGAPEVVLAKCVAERCDSIERPLGEERRREIFELSSLMASKALRVLALAYKKISGAGGEGHEERDLVFVGLAGMLDPPREEAKEAVLRCRQAGIVPVMITGDHPATALAIARELGMAGEGSRLLIGREIDSLSDEVLAAQVDRIAVYARVTAEHKLRVVKAWKARGQVVAMTGDGVNDAPAVKAADIGIAMGVSGTDVTKEASDMILTDDNFASIVNAVEEGRGIFDNIQKFVHFLLASNASEVLLMFVAALMGWPPPLVAIQILWLNLVTDGLPALALGMEPPERDIMRRPPRPPREPVLTLRRGLVLLIHGALIAGVTLLGFAVIYRGEEANLARARTMAFCVLAYAQLFYSFACRSQRFTLPELGVGSNPFLFAAIAVSALLQLCVTTLPFAQPVFEVATHLGWEWFLLFALALTPVTVIEVWKLFRAARRRSAG